ncbi:MAG: hypothetical protein L0229_02810, partial [Blastocatellia bacterium]|nr:hypothetical protein [Blastocatellia bacterium]
MGVIEEAKGRGIYYRPFVEQVGWKAYNSAGLRIDISKLGTCKQSTPERRGNHGDCRLGCMGI